MTASNGQFPIDTTAGATGQKGYDAEQERTAMLFMLEDLERSQTKIKQSRNEWLAAMDVIADPIFMHDKDYRIMRCNRAYAEHAGMSFNEVLGKLYWEVFPKLDDPQRNCCKTMQQGEEQEGEEIQIASGEVFQSRSFLIHDDDGSYLYSLHIMEDITERKQAEARLKLFRALLDNSGEGIEVVDPATLRLLDVNETECSMLGYSREELLSMSVGDIDPISQDDHEAIRERLQKSLSMHFETVHRRKDGSEFPVELSMRLIELDKPYVLNIVRDITELKQAERALQHTNRALATLSASNHALIHATDEKQFLQDMCRAAVENGGYRFAWIGYPREDVEQSLELMAKAGEHGEFLTSLALTWADNELGNIPSAMATRSGTTQIAQDIMNDPRYAAYREEAHLNGYAASIALPLLEQGRAFGVLVLYADEANAFDIEEVVLLEEMAADLTFGILSLRLKEAHSQHQMRLQESLLETIQSVAAIVEMRDPYTAGHQRRVAELARAIARELQLPEDECQAIYLAGVVHDVGKISLPSEILSKPGKLNSIEVELTRTHAQAGYDILKTVHFPWPIAQIVLQHHERVDGSGYPNGLKGEQILLAARILGVADVVEAMSSHRPYRASLGMEAALQEIIKKRGSHFDPQVVDACIRLIHAKHFVFAE